MANYTLFGQGTPTAGGSVFSGNNTNGTEFSVSGDCTLDGIWFYSPATAVDLPVSIGLFTVSGQTLVTSNTPAWSGAAASGWVYAPFTSPPLLTAGVNYMAAVCDTSGNAYLYESLSWWSTGPGSGGITSGPLSAPGGAGTQGFFGSGPLQYPSSQFSSANWWVDPQVSTSSPPQQQLPPIFQQRIR